MRHWHFSPLTLGPAFQSCIFRSFMFLILHFLVLHFQSTLQNTDQKISATYLLWWFLQLCGRFVVDHNPYMPLLSFTQTNYLIHQNYLLSGNIYIIYTTASKEYW